jgi:hypothetical protein
MTIKLTLRRKPGSWPRVYRDGKPTKYYLNEGSFSRTSDDRIGRWYIQNDDNAFSDKRGPGCRTQAEALENLREMIADAEYLNSIGIAARV